MYQRILCAAAVLGLVIGSAGTAKGATLTWIDTPRASAQVVQPFSLGGWSIDLAATRSDPNLYFNRLITKLKTF